MSKILPVEHVDLDIVDTRTDDEKRGDIIERGLKVKDNLKGLKPKVTSLNSMHKAIKDSTRKLALDYSAEMVLNLVEIAKNAQSESARVEASKNVLWIGLGRPGTTVITSEGGPIIPHFKIYFGDKEAVSTEDMMIDAEYTVESDD